MKVKSQLGRYPTKNLEPAGHLQQPSQGPQQLMPSNNTSGTGSALDSHMVPLEQVSGSGSLYACASHAQSGWTLSFLSLFELLTLWLKLLPSNYESNSPLIVVFYFRPTTVPAWPPSSSPTKKTTAPAWRPIKTPTPSQACF